MRVRPEHWALLLDMCEKNPEIVTNKFKGTAAGQAKRFALWQIATEKLNGLGYGQKTPKCWRKALTDWKSKTKSKAEKLRETPKATDDGSIQNVYFSPLEMRLLNFMESSYVNIKVDQSWEEEHLTLIVHTDDSFESPPSPILNGCSDVKKPKLDIEPERDDHVYSVPEDSSSVHEDFSELPHSREAKRSSNPTETTPVDHDYYRRKSSTSVKRPPKLKTQRRVKLRRQAKLSNRLAGLSRETLQTLKNINENTHSIAESLKEIAAVMKNKLQ